LQAILKLLQLHSISLVQFKNYAQRQFRFTGRIVGICGPNGIGKTNLLDAIYYLCFTKSYFGRSDSQNAHAGLAGFRLEGDFILNEQGLKALCIVRDTGRKEFSLNGDAYEKFALHVGKFPCVIIAPDDIAIITEGSEARRRFIDAILSQLDPEYLQRLIDYNKILQQRNSCLKSMADNRIRDISLLDVYDQQLVPDGNYIFRKRKAFLDACIILVKDFYKQISGNDEAVDIIYESQLHTIPFDALLKNFRERDMQLQRTSGGIHKDDLQIFLNTQPFKNIASQGQRKSLLFALKLSEFEMLRINKKFAPILLLDDVFEKLDEQRMHNLLDKVCVQNDGQIFITDTHRLRIEEHFNKLGIDYQLIDL
jgi:DNA replication and repair protein RecF